MNGNGSSTDASSFSVFHDFLLQIRYLAARSNQSSNTPNSGRSMYGVRVSYCFGKLYDIWKTSSVNVPFLINRQVVYGHGSLEIFDLLQGEILCNFKHPPFRKPRAGHINSLIRSSYQPICIFEANFTTGFLTWTFRGTIGNISSGMEWEQFSQLGFRLA